MSKHDVLGLSHANEDMAQHLLEFLDEGPIGGVRGRNAHPQAAKLGVRALGATQIMDCYPGNLRGDPDQVAAAMNMAWFGDHAGNANVVIHDMHNNTNPGNNFLSIGSRALQASIASGYLLGYNNCVVSPCAFFEAVPNGVAIETSTPNRSDKRSAAKKLYDGLAEIALHNVPELQEVYRENKENITYLRKYDVIITPGSYTSPTSYVSDPGILRALEAIPPQPAMTPFSLDPTLRAALGIQGSGELLVETWNYDNMSADVPNMGEYNGRLRKVALGALLQVIDPPVDEGDWTRFKDA